MHIIILPNQVLFEKLMFTQVVNKVPVFMVTEGSIAFLHTRHLSLSWATEVQNTPIFA